jgi:hypothetical protein
LGQFDFSLEHVPENWNPVFQKGHATTKQSRAHRRFS